MTWLNLEMLSLAGRSRLYRYHLLVTFSSLSFRRSPTFVRYLVLTSVRGIRDTMFKTGPLQGEDGCVSTKLYFCAV